MWCPWCKRDMMWYKCDVISKGCDAIWQWYVLIWVWYVILVCCEQYAFIYHFLFYHNISNRYNNISNLHHITSISHNITSISCTPYVTPTSKYITPILCLHQITQMLLPPISHHTILRSLPSLPCHTKSTISRLHHIHQMFITIHMATYHIHSMPHDFHITSHLYHNISRLQKYAHQKFIVTPHSHVTYPYNVTSLHHAIPHSYKVHFTCHSHHMYITS